MTPEFKYLHFKFALRLKMNLTHECEHFVVVQGSVFTTGTFSSVCCVFFIWLCMDCQWGTVL
jgi:hypothetical protein